MTDSALPGVQHSNAPLGDKERVALQPSTDFRAFYEEHVDFVWRTVQRFGVPSATTQDVVQEVFIAVHRHRDGFANESSPRTWLYKIAKHTALNTHRTASRRPQSAEGVETEELQSAQRSPEADAERNEAMRELSAIIATMHPDQRETFLLMELEGMNATEVSAVTNTPVNTVYSRLRLARAAFEAAIGRVATEVNHG